MQANLEQLRPLITQLFELSCSPGLSLGVLHEGEAIFSVNLGRRKVSDAAAPNDDTIYNVASITKLMTAGVISNLVEQGLMDWDIPIYHYLPEFGERKDVVGLKATVADLLANRTGLSAGNTFWGAMYEDIHTLRETIPRLACHIPAYGEFGKTFAYSAWGYAIVTAAIERVTGKLFSVCVAEYVFQPLGMIRSTLNIPTDENAVYKHWISLDGVAHEFPWSSYRGWCDELGFGGAVGGRSTTKELLIMYKSLLYAFRHQQENNVDSTPGSPFKYARRILSPHVAVGNAGSYCLGTYRTQLPGDLSLGNPNSILMRKNMPIIGKSNAGREIFHQVASFTGYNGTMLLDPQSQSAIFVLVNSLPLFDVTDLVAQLILGTLLKEESLPDYLKLAKSVMAANKQLYSNYAAGLDKRKTNKPMSFTLNSYEGEYWQKDGLIGYSVRVQSDGRLQSSVKGSPLTKYVLEHWGGDVFCFVPDRTLEISRSIWPFSPLKARVFTFNCHDGGVSSFTWHHDPTPGSKPEIFVKRDRDFQPKL